jgi:hypothetical protein
MATTKHASKKNKEKRAVARALVDERLKAHWLDAITRYRNATSEEIESWDARYEALDEILHSDPPLYLGGGHRSVAAFLRVEAPDLDERTAKRYARVARHFEPADEKAHGIHKLDALLDYLEAAGGGPLGPTKINLAKQRVVVPEGKGGAQLLFSEVSIPGLRAARRAARATGERGPARESPVATAVRLALGKAKLTSVSVRVSRGVLHLGGIPFDRDGLARVARALLAVKLPQKSSR